MNKGIIILISAVSLLFVGAANASARSGVKLSAQSDTADLDWVIPEVIHTAKIRMAVNQTGQVGCGYLGSSFTYFADSTKDRIDDGSLILGNAADNLSWRIWNGQQPAPTPANPYGPMFAMSHLTIDSTSSPSYTVASGKGTNRDSTIGFDVSYYAPKHIDSSDFYIIHFDLYKGVNDPLGTYAGMMVAFAVDWDMPSDSVANNSCGFDESRQMVYQRGETSAAMQQQFGAVGALRNSPCPVEGGFTWDNRTYVYPRQGFQADSVWKYTSQINQYSCATPIADLSTILVIGRNLSINGAMHDTISFSVILAGQLNGSLQGLQRTFDKARNYYCMHGLPIQYVCDEYGWCNSCGDANSDGSIDISDAIFLIQAIFNGGPMPNGCYFPLAMGDANGDNHIDISDAVYVIAYIFSGGPTPHCWRPPCN